MQQHVLSSDWAVPIHLHGISKRLNRETTNDDWSNPKLVMTVWWATMSLSLNYTLWAEKQLSEASVPLIGKS